MNAYFKKNNENVTMSFGVNNKQLLENYNRIWEKVEKSMRVDYESKSIYGDDNKYIKTKIKIYAGSIATNFHNKNIFLKKKHHVSVYQ